MTSMGDAGNGEEARWDEALDWLLRLAEAPAADRATQAAFVAWTLADPRNRAAFERARATWSLAGHALQPRTPVAAPAVLWRRRAVAGAGLAAAAAAGAILLPRLDQKLSSDLATDVGEVASHRLPDGSLLTLDAASAVSLDKGPARRGLGLIEGRLFVEVPRAPRQQALAVAAGEVTASGQGTGFAVALGGAGRVEVAVASGRVEIVTAGGRQELGQGWAARIDRAAGTTKRRQVAPAGVGAWRDGRLVVEDASVAEAVAELGRYHHGFVLFRDPALEAARISGVFDLAQPARALTAMVAPHGGRVRKITGLLLVVERG